MEVQHHRHLAGRRGARVEVGERSFHRVDKFLSDCCISSFDVTHGRNHRMTPPREFLHREISKTTARAGYNNDFSAHLETFL